LSLTSANPKMRKTRGQLCIMIFMAKSRVWPLFTTVQFSSNINLYFSHDDMRSKYNMIKPDCRRNRQNECKDEICRG
jgi:hypothetical protein